jgi:hypothetical protein
VHGFRAAHRLDRVLERRGVHAVLLEDAARFALVLGGRQQEKLGGDELVAALRGFLVGEVQQVVQVAGDGDLAAGAFHPGKARNGLVHGLAQGAHVGAGALQERDGAAVLLGEERGEQGAGAR